jgi:autotransporter-associated beta strand protein
MGDGTSSSITYLSQGGGSNNSSGMPLLLKSNLVLRPTSANQNNTNLTLAANVTQDATPRKIIKTNVGTLTLSGNNSFTGGLDLNVGTAPINGTGTSGIIVLGSAGALSGANVVSFGPAATYTATLRLNGDSASIAGLRTTGAAGTSIVENASATAATLTINNAAAHTFAGTIQDGAGTGKLSVVKTGAGVQIFSGSNTYAGDTSIAGGTLAAAASANLGDPANKLVLNGGTLRTDGSIVTTRKS